MCLNVYPDAFRYRSRWASVSEMHLNKLCDRALLSLWCFRNPYIIQKTKKELCDELVIFKNHIFIFSDKLCRFPDDIPLELAWNRWYKKTIEDSARQILGAEQQLKRDPKNLFVDRNCQTRFPFDINITSETRIHRIIVAKGAENACLSYTGKKRGSLLIDSRIEGNGHKFIINRDGTFTSNNTFPFAVGFPTNRDTVFHIFDDVTLDILMTELDTLSDFASYLTNKEDLFSSGKVILADGEEDILACYLSKIENDRHTIVSSNELEYSGYSFSNLWDEYVHNEGYLNKKEMDKTSYIWDELIEKAFMHIKEGTSESSSIQNYEQHNLLFTQLAELGRLERRVMADAMISSYYNIYELRNGKPFDFNTFTRTISSSEDPNKFIILLVATKPIDISLKDYRIKRKAHLEYALKVCRYRNPDAKQICGIAYSANRSEDDSEDIMCLDLNHWNEKDTEAIKQQMELIDKTKHNYMKQSKIIEGKEYEDTVTILPISSSNG